MSDARSRYQPGRLAARTRTAPFVKVGLELPRALVLAIEQHANKTGKLKHEIYTEALEAYFQK